jgi:hypothetical protein
MLLEALDMASKYIEYSSDHSIHSCNVFASARKFGENLFNLATKLLHLSLDDSRGIKDALIVVIVVVAVLAGHDGLREKGERQRGAKGRKSATQCECCEFLRLPALKCQSSSALKDTKHILSAGKLRVIPGR